MDNSGWNGNSDWNNGEYNINQAQQAKEEKRRRRKTVALVLVLSVFLIAIAATAYVWTQKYWSTAGSSSDSSSLQSSSQQQSASQSGSAPKVEISETPGSSVGSEDGLLTIPQIYERLSPSVVMIIADSADVSSLGTGIVMSSDGYIITNAHVIDGATKITIIMYDNKTSYQASIVGQDNNSDIAVLKVEGVTDFVPAQFGDSDKVVVGETVVSIGNPYATQYAQTVTDGIISGIRKGIYVNGVKMDLLQTNAQLNPGNSGGPLINMYGQVIGINNSKIMSDGDLTIEGMGFAIPMTQAKAIVDELIQYGKVAGKPVIGVTVSFVDSEMAQAQNAVVGAKVESIDDKSDAYSKGLRIGDIITTINGKTFDSLDGFISEKDKYEIGDTLKLTYWRNGNTYDVSVVLVESVS